MLGAIGTAGNLTASQLGMLVPATPEAASTNNHWNIAELADQVQAAAVTHVGTWFVRRSCRVLTNESESLSGPVRLLVGDGEAKWWYSIGARVCAFLIVFLDARSKSCACV